VPGAGRRAAERGSRALREPGRTVPLPQRPAAPSGTSAFAAARLQSARVRGRPNRLRPLLSKRVSVLIRSPARVRTIRPLACRTLERDPSHRRDAKYGPAVDHLMIRSPPLTADPVLRDWIGIHAGRCCRSLELRGPPGRGHLAAVDANGRHWGDSVIPYGISSGRELRVDGRIPRAPVGRPRAHL